jgi:hypothetical protein
MGCVSVSTFPFPAILHPFPSIFDGDSYVSRFFFFCVCGFFVWVCGVGLVTGALEPQFNIVLTMVYYAGGKGKADIVSSATVPVNSMDTLLEVWCRVFCLLLIVVQLPVCVCFTSRGRFDLFPIRHMHG